MPQQDLAPLGPDSGLTEVEATIIRAVDIARSRSATNRMGRRTKNRTNWDFANGEQNWTGKVDGQSTIFLPDLPIFIEQVAGVIETRLCEFRDWFSIETAGGAQLLDPDTMRVMLNYAFERLWCPGDRADSAMQIQTVISEAVKMAMVESMLVLKVYGIDDERPIYRLETGKPPNIGELLQNPQDFENQRRDPAHYRRAGNAVQVAFQRTFKLAIEVVPFEDHFPDTSPADLYDIHEVDQHITDLFGNPDYDPEVVERLRGKAHQTEEQLAKQARAGESFTDQDPWVVRVTEYWGDLVNPDTGKIMERNCLLTKCGSEILRPPTRNPFWHQRRPFIKAPLLRTPVSTSHRALLDLAVPVAEAQNEVFSLMVDAGISSVWGIKQYHPDMITNSDEFAKGIPPGSVGQMRKGERTDIPFIKRVDEKPDLQNADLMLQRLGQSLQQAMMINDLQVGQLPPRQVKATEVVEASQSSDALFEVLCSRLEKSVIEPAIELSWLTLWQYIDDFSPPELAQVLGQDRMRILTLLSREERFVLMANNIRFKARGLRQLAQSVKQFQRIQTIISTVMMHPALAMVWDTKYSPLRTVDQLVRSSGLDPTTIERRIEELEPHLDPNLLLNQAPPPPAAIGGVPPEAAISPEAGDIEAGMAVPNPTGDRGTQI